MGELWVNYAELADAIGEDGAEKLCRAVGGVSTYCLLYTSRCV